MCSYSGVSALSTGLLNLFWAQRENSAFILVVYLVAYLIASMSNLARAWLLNYPLRDQSRSQSPRVFWSAPRYGALE